MKEHFINHFTKKGAGLSAIDWDYWLLGEGLPDWDLVRWPFSSHGRDWLVMVNVTDGKAPAGCAC